MKNTEKKITRTTIAHSLDKMRELKVLLAATKANRDKYVLAVVQRFAKDITTIEGQILELDGAACRWAVDNRASEFGENKTLTFESGAQIQFRLSPKSITLEVDWTEADVLEALEKNDLKQYIRTERTVDRAALVRDIGEQLVPKLANKCGVSVTQSESCSVKIPMATAGKETK